MNKRSLIIGGVSILLLGGIVYYFYRRRKKTNAETQSIYDPQGGLFGGSQKTIEEEVDKSTKGYIKLSETIARWKDFLKQYLKDGLVLKDIKTGGKTSIEGTESAYIFATKEVASIVNGINKDASLNNNQKALLNKMANSYYYDYLPLWFDKSKYNQNAKWYQDKISQMTLIDYYNK